MAAGTQTGLAARIARLRAERSDRFGFREEVLLAALDDARARYPCTGRP